MELLLARWLEFCSVMSQRRRLCKCGRVSATAQRFFRQNSWMENSSSLKAARSESYWSKEKRPASELAGLRNSFVRRLEPERATKDDDPGVVGLIPQRHRAGQLWISKAKRGTGI